MSSSRIRVAILLWLASLKMVSMILIRFFSILSPHAVITATAGYLESDIHLIKPRVFARHNLSVLDDSDDYDDFY
jgi:hypothetical protein